MEFERTALRKKSEDERAVWAFLENAVYILLGIVINAYRFRGVYDSAEGGYSALWLRSERAM